MLKDEFCMKSTILARLSCLECPNTRSRLNYVELGEDAVLVSEAGGLFYPIIDGVIVMCPAAPAIKEKCSAFIKRNYRQLESLKECINIEKTSQMLLSIPSTEKETWHEKEMIYWERSFEIALSNPELATHGLNRTLPRQKLLSCLPKDINHGILLEIGCGATHTLSDIYGSDVPNYIGLDLSFNACLLAKQKFPRGLFIQASVENPPFSRESLDIIVAYGVMHHLPGHECNVDDLLVILKPGGYFVGADPLLKPRILSRTRTMFRPIFNYLAERRQNPQLDLRTGMSPHNDWIDWENLKKVIDRHGAITHYFMEYSVLRYLMVRFFYDRLHMRGATITKFMIFADILWLSTIGKLHKAMGPAAVHYAIRKNGNM
jgi:SAM-dependent methyltransferase/uncharacterized protein YbaR (Trm112 family)